MFDFSNLQTPKNDGDILIEPVPDSLRRLVEANARLISQYDFTLAGVSFQEVRNCLRRQLAGADADRIIVTGHQPEFFPCGVWAKHVVCSRLAQACGGAGVNLVVDNDAPRSPVLNVPSVGDAGLTVQHVPYATTPAGVAFEEWPAVDRARWDEFRRTVVEHARDYVGGSPFESFAADFVGTGEGGWVSRMIGARHALDRSFGIDLKELRVSEVWCGPLLAEVLSNAGRFCQAYNAALQEYRRRQKISSAQHPLPDLLTSDDRLELPLWIYRAGQPRRRLHLFPRHGEAILYADDQQIGAINKADLADCDRLTDVLHKLGDWKIRPRALMLTLWARVLLADLFVHGIGGAKYDRITNHLIRDYFGVTPPGMLCASATVCMDFPRVDGSVDSVRGARRAIRDFTYNPQRWTGGDMRMSHLVAERNAAVQRSDELRRLARADTRARREVFDRIRRLNHQLAGAYPEVAKRLGDELEAAVRNLEYNTVARSREYFFGLLPREKLEALTAAFPGKNDYG